MMKAVPVVVSQALSALTLPNRERAQERIIRVISVKGLVKALVDLVRFM